MFNLILFFECMSAFEEELLEIDCIETKIRYSNHQ